MKITTDIMQGLVPDYSTQVMPEEGQVYAFTEQSYDYIPSPLDYTKALDYADKNVVSPKDASFKPIYGAPVESVNAQVHEAQPVLSEVVVTRDVPTFDFKKAILVLGLGYFAFKYFKKGRA